MKYFTISIKIIVAALTLLIALQQDIFSQNIIIKGTVSGDLQGHDQINMYNNVTEERDSATIKDGEFSLSIPFSVPTRYMFSLEYASKVKGGYVPFGILVEQPDTVYLKASAEEGLHKAEIKGSVAHERYERFLEELERAQQKVNQKLSQKYGDSFVEDPDENDSRYNNFINDRDNLEAHHVVKPFEKLINERPDSYTSVFVLDRQGRILDADDQQNLFEKLDPDLQDLHEGQKVADRIRGLQQSKLGETVADFTLPDPEGNPVDISTFRGQYVLIDFWASWCSPCIESFPHLRELYSEYEEENFEILAIDIDSSKERWFKAMEEHPNPWIQVYDDQNISSTGFAVTSIPATFLINPEGEIIGKNLRGDELDKRLKQIFDQ